MHKIKFIVINSPINTRLTPPDTISQYGKLMDVFGIGQYAMTPWLYSEKAKEIKLCILL